MISASHRPILISDEYRRLQQRFHENPRYGEASVGYASYIAAVLKAFRIGELLDYGAGKGRLGQTLSLYGIPSLNIHHYDPSIPKWSAEPAPCQCVACIDVLEHVEPAFLNNVLDDLKRLTLEIGIISIHTGPAKKLLPDGRNAHLIQQPSSWWLPMIMTRFHLMKFDFSKNRFIVVVQPYNNSLPL